MSGQPSADPSAAEHRVARRHIPALDGMRAIAFMFVFVGHAGLGHIVPGGFGVTVFFFLSGFLITTLLRLEIERSQGIGFKHFYLRRVLRILPSYYLVLGGAMILTAVGVLGGALRWGNVLSQIFYVNNYWQIAHGIEGQPAGTEVYWSLAVEEHFYLVFPAALLGIVAIARTQRAQAGVIGIACAAVLVWRCVLVFALDASIERTYYATDTRIDSILFGSMLALYMNPALDPPVRWRRLFPALVAAAATLLVCLVVRNDEFRETLRYSLQGLALMPIFIAVIAYSDRPVVRWLDIGWVRWVGRLSYGAYLVHYIIIALLIDHTGLPALPLGVVALAATLIVAEALQRYVDDPMARLRARYR